MILDSRDCLALVVLRAQNGEERDVGLEISFSPVVASEHSKIGRQS